MFAGLLVEDHSSSLSERVVTIYCLDALDLGVGVEQPFNCLIIQNRQAVQSMGVDGLDIGRRRGRRFVLLRHTHRPQRRPYLICASKSGKVQHQRRLGRTHAIPGGAIPGGWVPMSGMKVRSECSVEDHWSFKTWLQVAGNSFNITVNLLAKTRLKPNIFKMDKVLSNRPSTQLENRMKNHQTPTQICAHEPAVSVNAVSAGRNARNAWKSHK